MIADNLGPGRLRITQHKRFALWAHSNFRFAKTSFIRKTLGEMLSYGGNNA